MVDDIQDVSNFFVSLLNVFSSSKITKKINVSETRSGKQEWTIQRNWQHGIHKTNKAISTTQYVLDIIVHKQTQMK